METIKMKCLLTDLPNKVQAALINLQQGIFNANLAAGLAIDPKIDVAFQVELVTAATYNTIIRTQTTTPAANEVSTDVTNAYNETTVTTPATMQTDVLGTSGNDTTDTATTYTEYST